MRPAKSSQAQQNDSLPSEDHAARLEPFKPGGAFMLNELQVGRCRSANQADHNRSSPADTTISDGLRHRLAASRADAHP